MIGTDMRPVLIHHVQKHPVSRQILHIEFHQVDLKEKVKANVPVEITGEAQAVTDKTGVLLTIHDQVEVEALPADLPENISMDVSGLSEIHQELKVKDLKAPPGVTILTDLEQTLVKIGSLVSREAEAEAAAEAAAKAVEVAQVPTEGETGEAAKEEEKKPELDHASDDSAK
jgi:large subunit ribosomal protein L25